jgi:acyl-coenzyme A synthetase/AMP-(fatty) acid ligase
VVAAVVPRDPAAPPTLEELRDHVGVALGRHRAPRELVIVDALPRTALGKLRRAGLPGRREGSDPSV